MVYSDEHAAYKTMINHKSIRHSEGQYVGRRCSHERDRVPMGDAQARHLRHLSPHQPEHTHRYATEFAGRHNARPLDTDDQLKRLMAGMTGRRLRYRD